MTRTPAPALTAEEARTVARFDAAPVPPEVVAAGERQEAMARAMYESCYGGTWDLTWEEFCETPGADPDHYRTLAAAAIAADPSPAEEAVKRVEALAEEFRRDGLADSVPGKSRSDQVRAGTLLIVADRLRAALASPAPAPQGEGGQR